MMGGGSGAGNQRPSARYLAYLLGVLMVAAPAVQGVGLGASAPTVPMTMSSQKLAVDSGYEFGASMAVDEDILVVGTAVIAANSRDDDQAYIFERDDGQWEQVALLDPGDDPVPDEQSPLDPSEGFGNAVDVDADAERVVVGDPGYDIENETQAGAIYIYERQPNGTWIQAAFFCCPIVNHDENELPGIHRDQPGFGSSVSLDGDRLAVGAEDANRSRGQVWIYERAPNGTWMETQTLTTDHGQSHWGALFGHAVALDGDTLAVGAPASQIGFTDYGVVHMYENTTAGWTEVERLTAPAEYRGDRWGAFGLDVDLHGSTLLTADPGPQHSMIKRYHPSTYGIGNKGYVFEDTEDGWVLDSVLDPKGPVPEFDPFLGRSLDLSQDGQTAVIGGDMGDPYSLHAGTAYAFDRQSGEWLNGGRLLPNETSRGDQLGHSVAISSDTIFVGAPYDDNARGGPPEIMAEAMMVPHVGAGGHDAGSVFGFCRDLLSPGASGGPRGCLR